MSLRSLSIIARAALGVLMVGFVLLSCRPYRSHEASDSSGAPNTAEGPPPVFSPSPTPGPTPPPGSGAPVAPPSFQDVRARVIAPHCARCHSTFVQYDQAFAHAIQIRARVSQRTMPPDQALNIGFIQMIEDWVAAGAKP